ncbi:hypothetical protein [Thaumasiovibrio sp. DFM-14]|uniref:hypothetical protein n=1 Tax=Thaumasiovibrio sp. DFM-14 TaxID=3384792 RepID=UPI0039A3F552
MKYFTYWQCRYVSKGQISLSLIAMIKQAIAFSAVPGKATPAAVIFLVFSMAITGTAYLSGARMIAMIKSMRRKTPQGVDIVCHVMSVATLMTALSWLYPMVKTAQLGDPVMIFTVLKLLVVAAALRMAVNGLHYRAKERIYAEQAMARG